MMICDACNIRTCHTYCDERFQGNLLPEEEWFCHECGLSNHFDESD